MINDDERAARIRKRKEQRLQAKAVVAAAASAAKAAAHQFQLELAQAGEQLCALCEEGGPSPLERKNRRNKYVPKTMYIWINRASNKTNK